MTIITDIPAAYKALCDELGCTPDPEKVKKYRRFGKRSSPNPDPEAARQQLFQSIHGVGVNSGNIITDIPREFFNVRLSDEFEARLAKIMAKSGGRPAKKAV